MLRSGALLVCAQQPPSALLYADALAYPSGPYLKLVLLHRCPDSAAAAAIAAASANSTAAATAAAAPVTATAVQQNALYNRFDTLLDVYGVYKVRGCRGGTGPVAH